MSGGYGNQMAGTAASGGKGGTMGGFDPGSTAGAGKGGVQPGVMDWSNLGQQLDTSTLPDAGMDFSQSLPDESGGMIHQTPTAPAGGSAAQPNAFEQGLNAMDQGMGWMQNAMGYQAPQIGGNYNVSGIDGQSYMNDMAMGRAQQAQAAMMSAPGRDLYDYDAAQAQGQSYNAAQLSDKNISDYMNPYTDSVIDASMNDLNKARKQALNSTGAAATAGGGFGGDRHAIMEAQNNADYMDQVARTSSQLRNQGYQNAQNAAMGDVSSLNQSYASNAGMAQQANLANQNANNARSQFVGSTANSNAMQTAMSNQSAANQMAALNAQLGTQTSIANAQSRNSMLGQIMGYDNANQQFNAGMDMNKDQFNAGQDQQSWQNQFAAANNVYGMGNDRWKMGQDATNSLANVGGQIDGINQNLINAVRQQWETQMGAPANQHNAYLAALAGAPGQGGSTTTGSYNPGKMDFLGMGTQLGAAGLMGSDMRLKENIQKVATVNGINLYSWDWNEDGLSSFPGQKPFGVMAQEIAETRPEAVVENEDGWLMVDYGKLPEVSRTVMGAQNV